MAAVRPSLLVLSFTGLLICLGCGGADEVGKTIPVQGKVLLGTDPLESGTVTFHPDSSKGNTTKQIAVGTVNVGDFQMAIGAKSGVLPGWYKVTVISTVKSNPKDEYSVPKSVISERYGSPDKTPLSAEVKEGGGPYEYKVTK